MKVHPFRPCNFIKHNPLFRYYLFFLIILTTVLPAHAAPVVKLTQNPVFASLIERGSNIDCMAFNPAGDLYYYGWNHGLERVAADQLPDGTYQLLLGKSDYASFFNDPALSEVKNITGAGIGFDSEQRVISFIKGVYRKNNSDTDIIKIGFVRCLPDGTNLETLELVAGENFSGLCRKKKAEGGYEELDVLSGEVFDVGERDLFQMKIVDLDNSEVILFTLWGLPAIFQVPSAGGDVTAFYRFDDEYPREMTLLGNDLLVAHNNGNIYKINLNDGIKRDFVSPDRLRDFFGVESGGICFKELDYEPVSNQIYCVAQICWNNDIPRTMMAISPDGSSITKLLDENSLTQDLAEIRTPPEGKQLSIQAVSVNPVAVSQGNPSLFLGDYWSGLDMVRMDLPSSTHTIYKNDPTGARLDLDFGSGESLLCFGPFGRLEGIPYANLLLPEGTNHLKVFREGVLEEYTLNVLPAFTIAARSRRGEVQVTWTHRPGIVRYDIFRSSEDDPDNFVKIADTVSTYSTYLDRDIMNDKTYLYTVAAVYEEQTEFSDVIASTPSRRRRPGNTSPVIYSGAPPEDIWTGSTFSYQVLAVDSNNDSLVYSLVNAPAGMTIDSQGLITWTPDTSQTGNYSVTVVASDQKGGDVSKSVPIIISEPDLALITLEVTPEELYFNAFGQTEELTVTGIFSDGSRQDLTGQDMGTAYRPDISAAVRINADGLVTAQNSGFAKIQVTSHEKTITVDVEVEVSPETPAQSQIDAVDALQSISQGLVRVRWNVRNGTVRSLHALGDRLTPPSSDAPVTIAQTFLLGNPDLFGLANLDDFPLENEYVTAHSGVTHMVFRQTHAGIKFDDNALYLHVDDFGQLISVNGDFDPAPAYPSPSPAIPPEDAVTIVVNSLAPQTLFQPAVVSGPEGAEQETVFEAGPLNDNPVASLRWLAMADGIHLTWWVLFFDDKNYCVAMVDAHTGNVLQVTDMAAAAIPGKAFLQSPDKVGDTPSSVTLPDHWFDLSNPEKPYPSWGSNTYVVYRYYPDDLTNHHNFWTETLFAQNFLNSWRNNDGKWIFNTNAYNWEDKYFTSGNIFYWMNHLHDYFVDIGFDHESRNMEAGNYGQGSEFFSKTGVKAYVRGGWVSKYAVNNACATYSTMDSSDTRKWFPVVQYGLFYKKKPGYVATYYAASDTSLDPDIIIHEYVHNVSNALVGGTIDLQPMWDLGVQAGAVSEGFSDFFACSLTNDPVMGEYETGDQVKGIRILPLGHPNATYNKVHDYSTQKNDGPKYKVALIFSSALWDLRDLFMEKYGSEAGRTKLERLVIDAMKMMPAAPDLLDARDALLAADSAAECSAHQKMLWEVFAARGMGDSAESKNAQDTNPTPGDDLPQDYTQAPEVGQIEVMGEIQLNVPVDIDVEGYYFTPDSRVYITDELAVNLEYVDFDHIDCHNLLVSDYIFNSLDQQYLCVEKEVDGQWVEHCGPINTDAPEIKQITPSSGIPMNQGIELMITGENLTPVHTVVITDPSGAETLPSFTVVDDSRISIPEYTFTATGQHRVILTSDKGEAQGVVLVEKISTERLDALRGSSLSHTYTLNPYSTMRDDDNTPSPYTGTTVTSISTELPSLSAYSNLNVQLMIPPGETIRNSTIDILHTESALGGTSGGDPYRVVTENAELHYREVITIIGAELSDGTVIDTGTVSCHLEITGNANRQGYYNVTGIYPITIAVLPDGSSINFADPSLIDPGTGLPYAGGLSFDPETSFGQVLLKALPPLSSVAIRLSGNPYAGTDISPETTFFPDGASPFEVDSDSFDLPLGIRVVFHPGHTFEGAGGIIRNGYMESTSAVFVNEESGQYSFDVTYRLVSDDPTIKLIYQK